MNLENQTKQQNQTEQVAIKLENKQNIIFY